MNGQAGTIYMLHFSGPYRHARHYVGKPESSRFLKVDQAVGGGELAELTCSISEFWAGQLMSARSVMVFPGFQAFLGRCCAVGKCCESRLSEYTVQGILRAFRSALSNAVREEMIPKNVASLVRVSKPRKSRKVKPWTVEEAQQFLASAREADDSLYAAFVLILVLGLRRGEVLGLAWELVDLDQAELFVGEQLQRVNHKILRRETKTEASEAPLPLPAICVAALKLRKKQQDAARRAHSERWTDTGLVFTTRYGTPIEPRNFNRSFDYRIARAAVRRINVHGTRKTCGTLLAALDVHPRVAMQILRHSRIAVTMEIYTEATSKATRDALKRLGDELSPPGD